MAYESFKLYLFCSGGAASSGFSSSVFTNMPAWGWRMPSLTRKRCLNSTRSTVVHSERFGLTCCSYNHAEILLSNSAVFAFEPIRKGVVRPPSPCPVIGGKMTVCNLAEFDSLENSTFGDVIL